MSYRDEYEDLPEVHPVVRATDQVADAMRALDRHPSRYLRWPFPELDELTGALGAGGEVWFVCAFSGSGKTSFVTSLIELWRLAGRRIYVMPLETRAYEFRTRLACMQVGVRPGDALTGVLRRSPEGEVKRHEIHAALRAQFKAPYVDQVMVSEARSIDVRGLERGLKEAKAFGADVVIVDHIDHVSDDSGRSGHAESVAVNRAAEEMAKANDLLLLLTSQLNLDIARDPNHLARYSPPRDQHVLMGGTKRQIATGMIGLYRKVRDRGPHETEEEYKATLDAARRGTEPATSVLDTTVMGVNAMKLRHYGEREGGRVLLGFEHGRVVPLAERDRYETHFGGTLRRVL
jgi:hypothetical protein